MNKPFKGLAFCCTSIPAKLREDLSQKLTSLGGIHYSDLMSDVNYLIVGDRKTDKYNYCIRKRHDVSFVKPDAILSIYELWLQGEESSDLLDITNYLLPVFSGLVVCISRVSFHDKNLHEALFREDFRSQKQHEASVGHLDIYNAEKLAKYIEANGGKVTESLTISNSCVVTTEKKGKRYLKAVEWGILVVHPIWVFDSMLRQASLNLQDYDIDRPNYSKSCLVWNKLLQHRNSMRQQGIAVTSSSMVSAGTNSTTGVPLPPKLVSARNPSIWNSIMGLNKNIAASKLTGESIWEEDNKGLEDEDDDVEDITLGGKDTADTTEEDHKSHIFTGLCFLLLDFSSAQVTALQNVIQSTGGFVGEDASDSSITHIIIPSASGSNSSAVLRTIPSKLKALVNKSQVQIVTEWFIERSVFYGKYTLDHWGKPLRGILVDSAPSKKLKICITGFTGIELLHIQKIITYIGFQFCESLTSSRDLMIVNIYLFKDTILQKSPTLLEYKFRDIIECPVYLGDVSLVSSKNKISAAKNWDIPIVSLAYIWETMELSVKNKSVTLPEITDLKWCIFVPKSHQKTTTLMEFMRSVEKKNIEEEVNGPAAVEEAEHETKHDPASKSGETNPVSGNGQLPQLPSPRKGSNQVYGRILGRSPKKFQSSSPARETQDVTLEEEDFIVGYASEVVQLPSGKRRRRNRHDQQ